MITTPLKHNEYYIHWTPLDYKGKVIILFIIYTQKTLED